MYKICFIGLALSLLLNGCTRHMLKGPELPTASSWNEVIDTAKTKLPHEGKLIQQKDGYAFIKVDDRYINELFPLLQAKGFHKPPYFRRKDAPGAHISVIYKNEQVKLGEVGQVFHFSIKNIATIKTDNGISYIVLNVDAPELEKLRTKYGLGPRLNNHEFHITIAKGNRAK